LNLPFLFAEINLRSPQINKDVLELFVAGYTISVECAHVIVATVNYRCCPAAGNSQHLERNLQDGR